MVVSGWEKKGNNMDKVIKFSELVSVLENNVDCVVLEVKPDSRISLITLGCFTGDEKLFRLTKGSVQTCTVWTDDSNYSWHWGIGGHTLVSDSLEKKGKLIQKCIEEVFKIKVVKW